MDLGWYSTYYFSDYPDERFKIKRKKERQEAKIEQRVCCPFTSEVISPGCGNACLCALGSYLKGPHQDRL